VPTQVFENQTLSEKTADSAVASEERDTSDFAPLAIFGFEYLSDSLLLRSHNKYVRALSKGLLFERIEVNLIAGIPLLKILPIPVNLISEQDSDQWSSKIMSGVRYSGTELELSSSSEEKVSKVGISMNTISIFLGLEFSL
jgi:hypothetical protein